MGTIVIYYSYSGNTRKYAENLAKMENADIYEIKDKKRPNLFKTFFAGCYKALSHGKFSIEPINIEFGKYDRIIICAPIWAGSVAPQVNNLFDVLPKDKTIDLHMISSSGESSNQKMIQWLESKGYKISNYKDLKQGEL